MTHIMKLQWEKSEHAPSELALIHPFISCQLQVVGSIARDDVWYHAVIRFHPPIPGSDNVILHTLSGPNMGEVKDSCQTFINYLSMCFPSNVIESMMALGYSRDEVMEHINK